VIADSSSIVDACVRALGERIDHGAAFAKGYRLDKGAADLVPATAIGRMLSPYPATRGRDPETAGGAIGEATRGAGGYWYHGRPQRWPKGCTTLAGPGCRAMSPSGGLLLGPCILIFGVICPS